MRIGLVIYGELNTLSGGYLYDARLVEYLEDHADDVMIFSIPPGSYWQSRRHQPGNRLIPSIEEADLDILIEDEWVHPAVFGLNDHLRRTASYPIVSLVHLLTSFDAHPVYSAWLYRHGERRHLKSVDGLILNSQTSLQQAKSLVGGELPPHAVAVPAGDNFPRVKIEPQKIPHHMTAPGPLKILFVGNVIPRKGLHVLIRAVRQLPRDDYQVTVAGRTDMEPRYAQQIKNLVSKLGLQKQVSFRGPVRGSNLAALYQTHHVMALPSTLEGYGIVYVEAQQFGLPVIGTTAGAAKEIITNGKNGYLIPPGSHQHLALRLKHLHDDRNLLLTLSRNARHAYRRHPTWQQSCATIRAFLETLV
ncbi:MAG: glycosyltransferase family 4 protein [Lentisphaeria bacterium]|nr:glycosyltransferase family 4 protein [Candidatus Neomarinimicrobiota bacterium]MCF7842461.1 glycosyltransferase family 4 protein [Lentisphaeria bacterium]